MPKNKSPIVKKETLYRENKYGKKVKLGVELTREDGTTFSLLNPSGKAAKYFVENQRGKLYTNAGQLKKGEDDKPLTLTKEQKAYRAGYIDFIRSVFRHLLLFSFASGRHRLFYLHRRFRRM